MGVKQWNGTGPFNYEPLISARELSELIHCVSWMQNGIPLHPHLTAPLQNLIEWTFKNFGKRTKQSIKSSSFGTLGCFKVHNKAFVNIQSVLQKKDHSGASRSQDTHLHFTDTSNLFWASVVTQCSSSKISKPLMANAVSHCHFFFLGFSTVLKKLA